MSNIKFSGRIYKDPEMRFTKNGKAALTWKMSAVHRKERSRGVQEKRMGISRNLGRNCRTVAE